MPGVAVVTDSTADLPHDLADERGLRVVPMSVTFGDETFVSGITITPQEFYDRLRNAKVLPTTAQPAPAWFEQAYLDCADDDHPAAVSIHVSKELSGTVSLARRMAEEAPLPVAVVDSRQVGGGLALMVLAAQRAAEQGASVEDVLAAAERVRDGLVNHVVVDVLDNMRKSGRVTGTQAVFGTVLKVKPILAVSDGRVEVFDRARTMTRALDRIVEVVADHLGDEPADVVVTHALAPERAEELWERLNERIEVRRSLTTVFGPVLGTHTGQGAVAVAAVRTTD